MTNTEIAEARWVTSTRNPQSGYDSISELFRVDAPADAVAELFDDLTRIRGAHRVEVKRRYPDYANGERVESPWFGLYFRGTDRALSWAVDVIADSGLKNEDSNADHDHDKCVAHAQSLGVPASWAHRVETYLSM